MEGVGGGDGDRFGGGGGDSTIDKTHNKDSAFHSSFTTV